MGKSSRFGQAEILNDHELDRIFKQLISPSHKLFFTIARYTGERFGAICQLRVDDVYFCLSGQWEPKQILTFRSITRKRSANAAAATRQVPVCERLLDFLGAYASGRIRTGELRSKLDGELLFPSRIHTDKPVTWSSADKWLRQAVRRAGLEHRGVSTHSMRRSFITKLAQSGLLDIKTLQHLTGHKDVRSLALYIGVDENKLKTALNKALS